VGKVFKKLKVAGYAARLENSFEEWGDKYHAHVHALIDAPSGGRGFIPAGAWTSEWLDALPAHLHPLERGAHVSPVRNLEASCTYLTKSPFFAYVNDAQRIVAGIEACKGMQRSVIRGSMGSAHCAAREAA
jgi:hypothetical protein